jgi:quinol monooxygenase YgiN
MLAPSHPEEGAMLVIAGTIRMDPAKVDEATPATVDVMKATRAEAGCVAYAFSRDLGDPGLIHVFEEWESQEALDAHFETPHMATFQKAMTGFGIQEIRLQRYEVSSVGPLGG